MEYLEAACFTFHALGISEKEKELTDLHNELDSLKNAVEHQRKKNNERQQHVEAVELESKELLKRLFPMVSVPSNLTYTEWLRGFEKKAKACVAGASDAETVKEGILQKLQRSVEQEESKWRSKADESRRTIKQMQSSFTSSEQELERLRRENKDVENLRRQREHLEMELEKAEMERSTYVTEVRELKDLLTELQKKLDDSYSEAVRQNEELNLLKTQLNETLTKLQNEQSERKKVADDLHKAQQSLNFIHSRISVKAAGDSAVIENSAVSPETGSPEKETMSMSLNQTVTQLQQLLQEVNQQLMKEK
ncbi:hypothetical protein A6R68_01244 [Neotoma lepida]|uniref:Kinectin n=1 Tax=Neotoma lepida TaxID=56216 RepID=A0A1A6GVL5_NEOLE|nr:hypothetical protein A6R68_01244 [Neotoma lepida]